MEILGAYRQDDEANEQPEEDFGGPALEPEKSKEKENKGTIDALVVFGAGIRTNKKIADMGFSTDNLDEGISPIKRLPINAKIRTVAAAELFLAGQVGDVIFTGGRVKEQEGVHESEAELMEAYFLHILAKRKLSELKSTLKSQDGEISDVESTAFQEEVSRYLEYAKARIKLEDRATNTIENFSNTINLLGANKDRYHTVGLLSNAFHLDRIVKLAAKHGVNGEPVAAESTVLEKRGKYQKLIDNYFSTEGNERYRDEVLSEFANDEEIDEISAKFGPGYGGYVSAEEAKTKQRLGTSFAEYQSGERRWSRGLDEIPEYWMQGLKYIDDQEQLMAILAAEKEIQEILKASLGIDDIEKADVEDIRRALGETKRVMPPAEWGNK